MSTLTRKPNLRVNLTKRIATDKGYRYAKAVLNGNGSIKPDYVILEGKEVHAPNGTYYLDWNENGKRQRSPAGTNATRALQMLETRVAMLHAVREGLIPPAETPTATVAKTVAPRKDQTKPEGTKRGTIADARSEFLAVVTLRNEKSTFTGYANALTHLETYLATHNVTRLDQITRLMLLGFVPYLEECERFGGVGYAHSTILVHFTVAVSFLAKSGIRVLEKGDFPEPVQDDVETFEDYETTALLAHANPVDHLLFSLALETGLRNQEIANLLWEDVLFGTKYSDVRVKSKQQKRRTVPQDLEGNVARSRKNWKPKTSSGRTIPISLELAARLKAVRGRPKDFVFPSNKAMRFALNGKPLAPKPAKDYLVRLKRVARKAGLNCDACNGCMDKDKKCERFWMHKFRATFATQSLQIHNNIIDVMKWLGHKSMASTRKYLAASTKDEVVRAKIDGAFRSFYNTPTSVPEELTPPHSV